MAGRKPFLLRIDPEVLAALQRWGGWTSCAASTDRSSSSCGARCNGRDGCLFAGRRSRRRAPRPRNRTGAAPRLPPTAHRRRPIPDRLSIGIESVCRRRCRRGDEGSTAGPGERGAPSCSAVALPSGRGLRCGHVPLHGRRPRIRRSGAPLTVRRTRCGPRHSRCSPRSYSFCRSPAEESAPPPEPAAEPAAANPNDQFAGAWSLVRSERRDADGELIGEPREDRVGLHHVRPVRLHGRDADVERPGAVLRGRTDGRGSARPDGELRVVLRAVQRQRGGGLRDPSPRGEPEPGRRRLGLPALLHHRGGHAEAPAAGQRGRLAVVHHLAAAARPARGGSDRHARAPVRRLPRRVGDASDDRRRAHRGRPVRNRVHHVRAVGAHVRAPDAAGPHALRRRRANRRRSAGDGAELRQLLRPVLGERGRGVSSSTTASGTRTRARAGRTRSASSS